MAGFHSNHFSAKFNVKVIRKRSFETLKGSLPSILQEISEYQPDVIYIHLGIKDIANNHSPESVKSDFISSVEAILKQTSQCCAIGISHILPCADSTSQDVIEETRELIRSNIAFKCKDDVGDLWNRVFQNGNSNFYGVDGWTVNKAMVCRDLVHLNDRGTRVIMGNFRSTLQDICEQLKS